MDVPDWFWQGVTTNLVVDSLGLAAWLTWKNRTAIARAVKRQPIVKQASAHIRGTSSVNANGTVVQLTGVPSDELPGTLTVSIERTASWNILASVGSERTALWNIEAPTRQRLQQLGDELLKLGSWYLHQS